MAEGVLEPNFQIVHSLWGSWVSHPTVSGWGDLQCESLVFRDIGSIGEREG
jgi:hypothetical protein